MYFEISSVGAQCLPEVKETTPHLQGMLSRQCLTLSAGHPDEGMT